MVAVLACVCSITPGLIYSLSYHDTDAGFRIGGVTKFGTQRFSPLLARKRRSMWASLQIG